jgi:hypothetical protein
MKRVFSPSAMTSAFNSTRQAFGHERARHDLTEHDLRGVLRAMVARGVNRSAVMDRNSLTQMFAWAEKRQPWRKLPPPRLM